MIGPSIPDLRVSGTTPTISTVASIIGESYDGICCPIASLPGQNSRAIVSFTIRQTARLHDPRSKSRPRSKGNPESQSSPGPISVNAKSAGILLDSRPTPVWVPTPMPTARTPGTDSHCLIAVLLEIFSPLRVRIPASLDSCRQPTLAPVQIQLYTRNTPQRAEQKS